MNLGVRNNIIIVRDVFKFLARIIVAMKMKQKKTKQNKTKKKQASNFNLIISYGGQIDEH